MLEHLLKICLSYHSVIYKEKKNLSLQTVTATNPISDTSNKEAWNDLTSYLAAIKNIGELNLINNKWFLPAGKSFTRVFVFILPRL